MNFEILEFLILEMKIKLSLAIHFLNVSIFASSEIIFELAKIQHRTAGCDLQATEILS